MQPYFIVLMMGITEEHWIVHTDIAYEDLGHMECGHFHYDPLILRTLVEYYTYTRVMPIGFTPPIPLPLPLEIQGMNIHRQIIIKKEHY